MPRPWTKIQVETRIKYLHILQSPNVESDVHGTWQSLQATKRANSPCTLKEHLMGDGWLHPLSLSHLTLGTKVPRVGWLAYSMTK
jgi:hypothetical protein